MDIEIKHKAFQVLIDKVDVATFEAYVYEKVESIIELKSDTLLFDFLCIDFKCNNYKKEIKNLIETSYSEEELLSLEVYEKCLRIKNSDEEKEIYNFLDDFLSMYIDFDSKYELIYELYLLGIQKDSIESGFNVMKDEELLAQIQDYVTKVITRFEFYKEKEDWFAFLNGVIGKEVNKPVVKLKNEKIESSELYKKDSFSIRIFKLLKEIFGLR